MAVTRHYLAPIEDSISPGEVASYFSSDVKISEFPGEVISHTTIGLILDSVGDRIL